MDATAVSLVLDNVRSALATFNEAWCRRVHAGEVYELPIMTERALPARIEPSRVSDTLAATDAARRAIALLERVDGQHPNRTLRLPGWFALERIDAAAFEHLNALKDQLRAAMAEIPLAQRKLVAAAHKRIAFLQAYRHVTFLAHTPARIDFAWARRITSQKVTTAGAVRKELRDTRPYKPAHMGDEEWASAVAFTEHRLAGFADTDELVYHRYVAATPKVLIWYTNDRKGTVPDAVHHAALPVFFRAGDQLPSVRPLQPYEPQPERETAPPPAGQPNGYPAGRKRRKDSHQLVPVLPELNLYRRVSPKNAR